MFSHSCNGIYIFIRWKMKCTIQLGFASLNGTFHFSPYENICTNCTHKHSIFVYCHLLSDEQIYRFMYLFNSINKKEDYFKLQSNLCIFCINQFKTRTNHIWPNGDIGIKCLNICHKDAYRVPIYHRPISNYKYDIILYHSNNNSRLFIG